MCVMTASSQQENYQYFIEHRDKLFDEYPDKFLTIKDKQVIGVYDDQVTAFTETTKEHLPGTFIIQKSSPDSTNVQVFHSRVIQV